jgi:hypothetical protein
MLRLTKVLMAGAAVLTLAACGGGGAEVASPGEGDFGNGGNNGGGNNGGGTNNPPAGTPAADCPTGTTNIGTVGGGTLRACAMPNQVTGALALPNRAGTVYVINGVTQVGVDRGIDGSAGSAATLTIDPGVRIFASGGSDALIINRGSQIYAEGTSTNPIIFTSRQNIEGTTTENSQGQWGGIILAGRAPQANCQLTAPVTCTGTVEGGTSVLYGGNTPTDSSGRLRYVQIKYSGFEVSPGNELQSLTLAGVGSGTTIEYIQSYNSSDDGTEIFGGNVNLRYYVIMGADDDGLDTDTGWRGGAQFGIVTQRQPGTTSRSAGFEFSAAPTAVPLASRYVSQPKISNFTIVGRNTATNAHTLIHLDTGSDATIINTVATNTGGAAACLDLADADTIAVAPTFSSVYLSCPIPYRTQSGQIAAIPGVFTAGANNTATGAATLTAPTGATITNQDLRFINGVNENAVTVTNPQTVYSWFTPVNYIGAVQNAADTWWRGWTCGLTPGLTC